MISGGAKAPEGPTSSDASISAPFRIDTENPVKTLEIYLFRTAVRFSKNSNLKIKPLQISRTETERDRIKFEDTANYSTIFEKSSSNRSSFGPSKFLSDFLFLKTCILVAPNGGKINQGRINTDSLPAS